MNAPARLETRNAALVPPEQGRYAFWLDTTSRLGLVFLVAAFLTYILGLLPAHVPLDRLPELWSHPAPAFMSETATPSGWGWLALVHRGDILNLLGIAMLSGGSILCLLAVIPLYARRGEVIYLALCALQVVVLLLAASGLLTSGH